MGKGLRDRDAAVSRWLIRILTPALVVLGLTALTWTPSATADTSPPPGVPQTLTADALPTAQVDGVVWKTAVVGSTVYAVGSFTKARPAGTAIGSASEVPRANIMAFDLTTGALLPFSHTLNAQALNVKASPDGSRIYVSGDFTLVDGIAWSHIVAFNTTTGAIDNTFIHSGVGGSVNALAVTADRVYFGGSFSSVGLSSRSNLAAFDRTNGLLTAWNPVADGIVHTMLAAPDNSRVVVGGRFQNLNGAAQVGVGAVDGATGASLPWSSKPTPPRINDNQMSWVTEMTLVNGVIYGSNNGNGSSWFDGRWAADFATGDLVWLDNCSGATYGIAVKDQVVYSVGHAHNCYSLSAFPETVPRTWHRAVAETTYPTGTDPAAPCPNCFYSHQPVPSLLHWFPELAMGTFTGAYQAAWSATIAGDYLVLGGEFPRVNGTAQQGLVRFTTRANAANKVSPLSNYQATVIPQATSFSTGVARVTWIPPWDYDNATLRYDLYRDNGNTPIYTTYRDTNFWTLPSMGYLDTGLAPGSTHTYRLRVTDPLGNTFITGPGSAVTISSTPLSPYAQDVIGDGAMDYWRLGQASGATTLYDWAGANDLTPGSGVSGGATGALNSDSDGATTFDGTTNGLAATRPVPQPTDLSVEGWVRTTTNRGGKIIGLGNVNSGLSTSYDRSLYMDNAGHFIFGVTQTVTSPGTYRDGNWHHVVGTSGSGGLVLYVDGRRVARNTTVVPGQAYTPAFWRIGGDNLTGWPSRPTSSYFQGTLDDLALYPTALTAQQVLDHWVSSGRTSPFLPRPTDAYGGAVYDDDPDLYWRLGESNGTSAADQSLSANNGTYLGGVTYGQTGALSSSSDTAVRFNGSTGGVAATNTTTNPTAYSTELWFRTSTTNGGKLIGLGNSRTGSSSITDRHVYMTNAGRLVFGVFTGGTTQTITSPSSYNDNGWHYLVATQGSSGMRLYVDDTLVASNSVTGAADFTGWWRAGGDNAGGWPSQPSSNFFNGTLDEVAVYTKVLSSDQILAHWTAAGGAPPPNQNPNASFTVGTPSGLSVGFNAVSSFDPDGTIASYAWDFGDGTTDTGISPTHTFPGTGSYTVTLTVTDNRGGTGTANQSVSVTAPNQNPTAAFSSSATDLAASFDGSGSSDSDGTVASYAWDFGDGGSDTGASPTHTYATGGTYTVTLTVTDDDGATGTVSHPVTVLAANTNPVAAFTSSVVDLTASFNGSGSSDSDGSIASYAWGFGDGTTGSGVSPTHSYVIAGTYTVSLTVTDNRGGTNTVTHDVTVTEPLIYASDDFSRTLASGWGSADKGGTWTSTSAAANFNTTGAVGRIRMASPSQGPSIFLNSVSTATSDTALTLSTDKAATGGGVTVSVVGRKLVGTGEYRGVVHFVSTGAVNVGLVRADNAGTQTTIAAEQAVPGLTYAVGDQIRVRLQVTGTSPTTLRIRAWKVGTAEPSTWQRTGTDATAAFQAAGGIGLMSYLSGSATNAPVFTSVDEFAVIKS